MMKTLLVILSFFSAEAHAAPVSNYPAYGDQHWRTPVANVAALPASGNFAGDARTTLDSFSVYVWTGSGWSLSSGTSGPVSSTNRALARWNGTSGTSLLNSSATLSDAGLLTAPSLNVSGLTASTVPYLDASKNLTSSAVTPTQLSYLDATSSIQTQLNGKQASGNYLTALTGDVTATGPGSVAATVATVGGSTASLVHSAEVLANASTNTNTVSTIVKRDASGNFSASTITAVLSGNASTASALAADPTDCGSNTFANAIAASGNLTCASVPNAATTAASANTASAIVARDASGNFSASTITAALSGNATNVSGTVAVANGGTGTSYGGGLAPVGSIHPWLGGYFGNGSNGSFTNVLANTVADVNTLLNSSGWYVCDGSAINEPASPIFNGAGRYLPNLTDSRFLMGSTSAGSTGGQNSTTISSANLPTHTHTIDHDHAAFNTASAGTHSHVVSTNWLYSRVTPAGGGNFGGYETTASGTFTTATDGSHIHSIDVPAYSGSSGNGGFANTAVENRPVYLSAFYIMRIK